VRAKPFAGKLAHGGLEEAFFFGKRGERPHRGP
jgi:hypothetical protein